MGSVINQSFPANTKARRWKKFKIVGDPKLMPKLFVHLNSILENIQLNDQYKFEIENSQSIFISFHFTDKEEKTFIEKYLSISDNFQIRLSEFGNDSKYQLNENIASSENTSEAIQLKFQHSNEILKVVITEIIISRLSKFSFSKTHILTLCLYLHFGIIHTLDTMSERDAWINGSLWQEYKIITDKFRFNPEIDYITNKKAINKIAKDVFESKKTSSKWIEQFYTALREEFRLYSYNRPMSYETFIIDCKLREQINHSLGISSIEIKTLNYFIYRELTEHFL